VTDSRFTSSESSPANPAWRISGGAAKAGSQIWFPDMEQYSARTVQAVLAQAGATETGEQDNKSSTLRNQDERLRGGAPGLVPKDRKAQDATAMPALCHPRSAQDATGHAAHQLVTPTREAAISPSPMLPRGAPYPPPPPAPPSAGRLAEPRDRYQDHTPPPPPRAGASRDGGGGGAGAGEVFNERSGESRLERRALGSQKQLHE